MKKKAILIFLNSLVMMLLLLPLFSGEIENPWDVNGDNTVNILDIEVVGNWLGHHTPVDCPFNPDVNDDGIIDIQDLTQIGLHYGESYVPITDDDPIVYITETGTKYHRDGCQFLKKSKIPIKKSEAIKQGYTPCSVCKP